MSLSDKAILAKVSISQWSGETEDPRLSRELCESHGARTGSARGIKRIVPERALIPIAQSAYRIYTIHKTLTLPWLNDGTRILKATAHNRHKAEIESETVVFDCAVETFKSQYCDLQYEAAREQGTLYNPADWPSEKQLSCKFGVSIKRFPLPDASDFRQEIFNHIKPEDRDQIIAAAKADESALHQQCVSDVFTRMRVVVGHLTVKLKQYTPDSGGKSRLHDSLVGNITNLVDLLPALNVTDDPRIEELGRAMQRELAGLDVGTLKISEFAREQAVQRADAFVDKLSAYGF